MKLCGKVAEHKRVVADQRKEGSELLPDRWKYFGVN